MTNHESEDLVIRLAPRTLLSCACLAIAAIVALNLARTIPGLSGNADLSRLVSLDAETSLGTAYAMLQLAVCASGAVLVGWVLRRRGLPWAGHWVAVGILLLVAAAEEIVALHERAGGEVRDALDTGGPLHFAWVIPGTIVAAALVVIFWRFVGALPSAVRSLVVIAAGTFVIGAIGAEMVGGWIVDTHGRDNPGYVMANTTEEALELLGVALFGYATARYLVEQVDPVWMTTAARDPVPRTDR